MNSEISFIELVAKEKNLEKKIKKKLYTKSVQNTREKYSISSKH